MKDKLVSGQDVMLDAKIQELARWTRDSKKSKDERKGKGLRERKQGKEHEIDKIKIKIQNDEA